MYKVRCGSLIIIARTAADAVKAVDQRSGGPDPVTVVDRAGKKVDIRQLRTDATAEEAGE